MHILYVCPVCMSTKKLHKPSNLTEAEFLGNSLPAMLICGSRGCNGPAIPDYSSKKLINKMRGLTL